MGTFRAHDAVRKLETRGASASSLPAAGSHWLLCAVEHCAVLWLRGVWPRVSASPELPSHCLVEIQVMMGSLVYLRLGLEKSPYCHLLDNSHWAEICETFTRDACSLLGLSVESPLSVRYNQR